MISTPSRPAADQEQARPGRSTAARSTVAAASVQDPGRGSHPAHTVLAGPGQSRGDRPATRRSFRPRVTSTICSGSGRVLYAFTGPRACVCMRRRLGQGQCHGAGPRLTVSWGCTNNPLDLPDGHDSAGSGPRSRSRRPGLPSTPGERADGTVTDVQDDQARWPERASARMKLTPSIGAVRGARAARSRPAG